MDQERVEWSSSSRILGVSLLAITASYIFWALQSQRPARRLNSPREVPLLSYWLPFLGHIPRLALNSEAFLKKHRDNYPTPIFGLNLLGTVHNIIHLPHMTQHVFSQPHSVLTFDDSLTWFFLHTVGGVPSKYRDQYHSAHPKLNAALSSHLLREPGTSETVRTACQFLEEKVAELVSGMDGLIDQSPWERVARAVPVSVPGFEISMEVDLLPLIINFTGHVSLPSIFGSDLLHNFPGILHDIWAFNAGFFLLALGLPKWLPLPSLSRAYAGRWRAISALTALHTALDAEADGKDPGPEWRGLDDVSAVIRARHAVYRAHGIPPHARSDLSVLWALNANSNFLVFWMLVRILSSGSAEGEDEDEEKENLLLAAIRAETASCVKVTYPPRDFGRPEHPSVRIDEQGLTTRCPLLKACMIECLRLDSAPWSLRQVVRDFAIPAMSSTSSSPSSPEEDKTASYVLRAGTYVDIPFSMHFKDAAFFPDPDRWDPHRHLVALERIPSQIGVKGEGKGKAQYQQDDGQNQYAHAVSGSDSWANPGADDNDGNNASTRSEQQAATATWSTIRPFGGGATMCKGRRYAEREVLAVVACVLAVWDIEPAVPAGPVSWGLDSSLPSSSPSQGEKAKKKEKKKWSVPRRKVATAVAVPKDNVRVRIARRPEAVEVF